MVGEVGEVKVVVRAPKRWALFKADRRRLQDAAAVRSMSSHALTVHDRFSIGRCLFAVGGRVGDGHIGRSGLTTGTDAIDGNRVT